ncbi:XRE family transcriptional regulator [Candidatus Falkowbacteria bacterium CG_4_8_14_3_um_filter_36_11]|nr:MAG: XRE family transcriptional regulator [Candidatus Falkowbacteria bacterium CG_4_8_14_3_um_filter_36_11]
MLTRLFYSKINKFIINNMNTKKLSKFLIAAKINTYALNGEKGEKKYFDGRKELKYKKDKYKYCDRYYGYNPFIGEEIVRENNKIIWGMNYYGIITSKIISPRLVYQFLKKALMKVKQLRPYRGPLKFTQGDLQYVNRAIGNLKKFNGEEIIFYKGKKIYELNYGGGVINEK